MSDAQQPAGVMMETGPAKCKRCGRAFAHFAIEDIEGVSQLRAGDLLITKIDANCLHCGWTLHWNIREKDVEKMAGMYGDLLKRNQGFAPE
jgi:predicted Zn-ribbon and HTH transcriptional regulator